MVAGGHGGIDEPTGAVGSSKAVEQMLEVGRMRRRLRRC